MISPEHRKRILAGKRPTFEFNSEGECPFELHKPIELLRHRVWVTFLRIRRNKKARWVAEYSVRDDRPNLLGKTGGYTTSSMAAIGAREYSPELHGWRDEPEAVDDDKALERLHREAGAARAWQQGQHRLREEKLRYERRLRDAVVAGRRGRANVFRARISRIDQRLDEAA